MAVWAKCRQRRPVFFQCPFEPSTAVGAVPSKKLDAGGFPGNQIWMIHRPFHFVRDHDALNTRLFRSNSSAAPAAEKLKH